MRVVNFVAPKSPMFVMYSSDSGFVPWIQWMYRSAARAPSAFLVADENRGLRASTPAASSNKAPTASSSQAGLYRKLVERQFVAA